MFVRRVPVHLNDDRKVLPTTRQVMFKPGDLILSGEPFGYCLYNEERMRRCDFCFKSLYVIVCKFVFILFISFLGALKSHVQNAGMFITATEIAR